MCCTFNQPKPHCTSFTGYGHNCPILWLCSSELKCGTSCKVDGSIDGPIKWLQLSNQTRVGMSALIHPFKGISAELVKRGPIEEGYEILIGFLQSISIVELSHGRQSVFEDGGIQLSRDQWDQRVCRAAFHSASTSHKCSSLHCFSCILSLELICQL